MTVLGIIITIIIGYFVVNYIQKAFFNKEQVLERKIKKAIGSDVEFIDTHAYKKYALILLEIDGKKGLINYKMDVIYPFELENIFPFGEYLLLKKHNKFGVIDRLGNIKEGFIWQDIGALSKLHIYPLHDLPGDNFYQFKKIGDDKWGIIDDNCSILCEPKFDELDTLDTGIWKTKLNGKWGVMNYKGEILISNKYDSIKIDYSSYHLKKQKVTYLIVSNGECFGLMNLNEDIIIPIKYLKVEDNISRIKEDLWYKVQFKGNNKFGIINLKNKMIIQFEWDDINMLPNNYFGVKKEGKWGIINKDNQIVIPIEYDGESYSSYEVDFYEGDFFKVKKGKHYGIVDIRNKIIIPFKWAEIRSCGSVGYFFVSNDKSYGSNGGVIDSKGNTVIPFEYSHIEYITDKYWSVEKEGRGRGIIDDENNLIIPFTFNRIMKNKKGYYAGQFLDFESRNYKWKIGNIIDKTELSTKYDWVRDMGDDKIEVINDGERYFIDFHGYRIA